MKVINLQDLIYRSTITKNLNSIDMGHPQDFLKQLTTANPESCRYILEIIPDENCIYCNESNIVFDIYSQKVPDNHNPEISEIGVITNICESEEPLVHKGRVCQNCNELQKISQEVEQKAPVVGA